MLDRAFRSAHAAADAGALEGRSGRARAPNRPFRIADDDFAVSADIEKEEQVFAIAGNFRAEQARGDITANVTADARGNFDDGFGVNGEAAFRSQQGGDRVYGR